MTVARISEDEMISVKATKVTDGVEKTLEIKTSSLMRSPLFYSFFKTEAYLHGCKMQLNFENDPAECFEILKNYLDEGPDRYTQQSIRIHIGFRYTMINRFVILIKLYALAGKLGLLVLKHLAYECMEEAERLVQDSFCLTLASLIYGKKAGFDKKLKGWCFKQISIHFRALLKSEEWADGVEWLDPELVAKWRDLVDTNESFESAVHNQAPPAFLERMVNNMPASRQGNLVSSIEERFKNMTREEVIRDVMLEKTNRAAAAAAVTSPSAASNYRETRKTREKQKRSSESWEEFGSTESGRSRFYTNPKARDVLGIGKRGRNRPKKSGASDISTTPTPSRPRGWLFAKGREDYRSKEDLMEEPDDEPATRSEIEVRAAITRTGGDVMPVPAQAPILRERKSRFFRMFGSPEGLE